MATYSTVHTTYGLGRISSAEATGTPINLTHFAVGDGSGVPVLPLPGWTALALHVRRDVALIVRQRVLGVDQFIDQVGVFELDDVFAHGVFRWVGPPGKLSRTDAGGVTS